MGIKVPFVQGINTMTGEELRRRIARLHLSYTEAAQALGLSYAGLHHQMRGERPVTRQTEMLLEQLERGCHALPPRRRRVG
jgi:plasmid maintenance system antidote protein VapI